jgi:hypothetical protein
MKMWAYIENYIPTCNNGIGVNAIECCQPRGVEDKMRRRKLRSGGKW